MIRPDSDGLVKRTKWGQINSKTGEKRQLVSDERSPLPVWVKGNL